MLVHESRILQVTIFGTLQINLESLDFSLVLPDVMTIADEVDAQLTQSKCELSPSVQHRRIADICSPSTRPAAMHCSTMRSNNS
jgi:hypothetical protein